MLPEFDGLGGWNSSGCEVNKTDVNYTVCWCNHLTHFGIFLDRCDPEMDPFHEQIIMSFSYSGFGVSSVFLGATIAIYLAFRELRQDCTCKILINLFSSLLMLNLVFLANSWSATLDNSGLCVIMSLLLHYFVISSFTWTALEAIHLYLCILRTLNIYAKNYLRSFFMVGWGAPGVTIVIVLILKRIFFGIPKMSKISCWIQDDLTFYIFIVAYFGLTLFVDLCMIFIVFFQTKYTEIERLKILGKMILDNLGSTTRLTILLGFIWGLAFFAWRPLRILFLYFFPFFIIVQGCFVFVVHCVFKDNVKKQWIKYFCCKRFQHSISPDENFRSELNLQQNVTEENYEGELTTSPEENVEESNL
ncbi:adhesion G-protein coupled receptor G2-like [Petaurus breviceps papuanus]|uniref:adhesion G-protein coupled receptor G2-like n=1 Tax=Petaurus breviceps papuanus TaxID=3040969 RepID=UPI0036DD7EB8